MIRTVFTISAFFSPLLFPIGYTLILGFIAGIFVPVVPLFVGIFTDLLYYTPNAGIVPLGSLIGLLLSLVAFAVRRFIKARIIT